MKGSGPATSGGQSPTLQSSPPLRAVFISLVGDGDCLFLLTAQCCVQHLTGEKKIPGGYLGRLSDLSPAARSQRLASHEGAKPMHGMARSHPQLPTGRTGGSRFPLELSQLHRTSSAGRRHLNNSSLGTCLQAGRGASSGGRADPILTAGPRRNEQPAKTELG